MNARNNVMMRQGRTLGMLVLVVASMAVVLIPADVLSPKSQRAEAQ